MCPSTERWLVGDTQRFRFRHWPDEATANAYDLRSGATHCLSPLGVELLTLLQARARTTAELAAELDDVFDDPAEACGFLQGELARLRTIGLVVSSG